jgi:3-isopropylmalate/(R)-2-methylmalate dehydratase large subunit
MTMTEKILAAHAGKEQVEPGDLIKARVDLVLGNDITSPVAIREFEKIGVNKLFDPGAIALVPDHFTPNKDIKSAEQAKMLREFVRKYGIIHYFEVGRAGIEHCLLPEQGLVGPGELIIGADSHTCTYGALGAFSTGVGSTDLAAAMASGEVWLKVPPSLKLHYSGSLQDWVGGKDLILYTIGQIGVDGALYSALEFTGDTIASLTMDDRFTMANMAIEAGAKNGIFLVDDKTREYLRGRYEKPYTIYTSDHNAYYQQTYEWNVSKLEPQVALPHLPENSKSVRELGNLYIDQVVIGSCTNGRIKDLREVARLLKGNKVHSDVRLIIIPGTQEIYLQAMREGLIEVFIQAGAVVSTPTCGPCLGGHMGILAKGERALATTNRNFIGRMGHPESEVYLSGPPVAAASAIKGRITHPEEVLKDD